MQQTGWACFLCFPACHLPSSSLLPFSSKLYVPISISQTFSAFQWINLSVTFPVAVQIQISQICHLHRGHFSCPHLQCFNGWHPHWKDEQTPPRFQHPVVPRRLGRWCWYSLGTDSACDLNKYSVQEHRVAILTWRTLYLEESAIHMSVNLTARPRPMLCCSVLHVQCGLQGCPSATT